MRKTLLFLAFIFCLASYAQNTVPPFINYQVVIRDASGIPIAAGSTVALNVKIFNDGTVATQAYEEDHAVVIPPAYIVNLRIGGGIPKPPFGSFSAIQWNLGKATYEVSMNGNTVSARGGFATVPYAFSSGSTGSSTSYSPSPNISTTGNILELTNKLSGTVSVGSNLNPNSKIPVFTADEKGRLMSAGEYPANISGDMGGRLDSQYVVKLRGTPLSTNVPIPGQVLQFNGSGWTPTSLSGSGPWSYSVNTIYPSNNTLNDKVAIGSGTATSLLDVKNTGLSAFTAVPVASFINLNPSYNATLGVVHISHQNGSGTALYVQNLNSSAGSNGIFVNMPNNASGADGIHSAHMGPGRAGAFISSSPSTTVEALFASANGNVAAIKGSNVSAFNSSLSIGIHGKTSNANANAAGIFGENTGGGFGVIGTNTANVASVAGINAHPTGTNAVGVYGLSNSSSTISAGVYGENKLSGIGVKGVNTNTNLVPGGVSGVFGTVVNGANVNSGVFGEAGGSANGVKGVSQQGFSVYGLKPIGTSGNAGRFENFNSSNSAEALVASTSASAAAIKAVSSGPGATLALHVDNGHIRSTSSAAPTFSQGGFNIFATPAYTNPFVNGTDVKGIVSANFVHSSGVIASGAYFEFGVTFNKPYSVIPIVVVSPTTDMQGMQFKMQAISTTGFLIRVYKSSNAGINDPSTIPSNVPYTFNYFVIE